MNRFVLAVAALFVFAGAPCAQEVQRIAAIVNEDVISMYDLQARMDLVVLTSRLPDSPQVRQRIQPQVLRAMIDEHLQLQEAKQRNISVSQADISRVIAGIESDNKMPPGGLKQYLAQAGLTEASLLDQIRASIAWQKLIARQFRPTVTITPEQVDEELAALKRKQGQEESRLSEILLTVDSPDEENTVRENARRLVEQVRGGARFDALARQFSQGVTAQDGGDRGWVVPDDSEPALAAALREIKAGEVSDPIRTIAGYHIMIVHERRTASTASAGETNVSLDQIFLPITTGNEAERRTQIELAAQIKDTVSGCEDMQRAAKEVRSPRPPHLGDYQVKDLSPQLRELIAPLKVGEASPPFTLPDGVLVVMVCSRDEPDSTLPDRDQVAAMLESQRLGMLARRHLRDLRLGSIVDMRI